MPTGTVPLPLLPPSGSGSSHDRLVDDPPPRIERNGGPGRRLSPTPRVPRPCPCTSASPRSSTHASTTAARRSLEGRGGVITNPAGRSCAPAHRDRAWNYIFCKRGNNFLFAEKSFSSEGLLKTGLQNGPNRGLNLSISLEAGSKSVKKMFSSDPLRVVTWVGVLSPSPQRWAGRISRGQEYRRDGGGRLPFLRCGRDGGRHAPGTPTQPAQGLGRAGRGCSVRRLPSSSSAVRAPARR